MKEKRIAIVLTVLAIVITIIGSTFAYFTWATNSSQNTAVTFTVTPTFSCSADGGGNITSGQKQLAPAACTNSTYAIQRTITTNITNSGSTPVKMNMNLKINSIGSNLSSSSNFKYAITSSNTNCTTGVINSGTFQGKVANDTVTLLEDATSSGTYYLWIWLDAAETNNNTQDQSFNFSLDGSCTNAPNYVYTANLWVNDPQQNYNEVFIGQAIANGITQYTTPEAAMAALKVGAIDHMYFLRHTIESNIVTESYVGFVITPAMAATYSGLTAGTYYLKGGDEGAAYNENADTLKNAFGINNCNDIGNGQVDCPVGDILAYATMDGTVNFGDSPTTYCGVLYDGSSDCYVLY